MIEPGMAKLASLASVLTATLALLSGVATAGTAPGPATFGAADPTVIKCQLMVQMHEASVTGTERQFFGYAQGYFAGRSAAVPATSQRRLASAGPDRAKQFVALLQYCKKNPEATFGDAVVALWSALQTPAP